MKPVPGRFWPSPGWRIDGKGARKVLSSGGRAGSRGRAIRRVNTVPIVCKILKI